MRSGRKVAKKAYTCVYGPLHNVTLYLASPSTAWMNFNGVVGRYRFKRHDNDITYNLIWEPK